MIDLKLDSVAAYLREMYGPTAKLVAAGDIGTLDTQGIKRFGYGKPLLVHFTVEGRLQEGVLSVMRGDKYGHQFYWDRAAILMFQFETSGRLDRHVKPLGLGYVDEDNRLVPVRGPREFFIFNEKLEGRDYHLDLERIRKEGLKPGDEALAREFARWLARVHGQKLADPDLYFRRIRDLIGSSECIMGLIDEAFLHPFAAFSDERFAAVEKRLIDWRWKLRRYAHRLAAAHGDFHPWNVIVSDNGDFRVLDRSRGEWDEPAGDVSTMAINYLLFGLYDTPRLSGDFERLYRAYFEEYLAQTNDSEILEVMAPYFVFRGLVIASPEWYPGHPEPVRQGLLRLIENVLADERFDWQDVNKYMV